MQTLKKSLSVLLIFIPILNGQIYLDSTASVENRVQDLLSKMTLDEKIGQMTQANNGNLSSLDDIKSYFLGSILSGGGSAPDVNTPEGWAEMYDSYQAKALETRLKIPIIYGVDAVHGHNNVKGAVIFPHNIAMGCTWDTTLVRKASRITAIEVAGTGIDWTFAPCIAVPQNERWGRTYEGFGETAEITKWMARASVLGFQGDSLNDPKSIVACAKHFVADGATTNGIDQGNAEIDETTLRAIHLPGYIESINAGVKTIMASYSSWNGQKVHGSKYLLTDLLKGELGFTGFIVSDWNGINQVNGDYSVAVKTAIDAGIDMAMSPDAYSNFFSTLKQLVNNDEIPMSRIDDAVTRILRVKFELGLFEHPFTDKALTDSVGIERHRLVAREAVRKSMVLLKKENGILPFNKNTGKILVAGEKADNLGAQCGGWTIEWQGGNGAITTGTTILSAIENAVSGASVVYSADGSGTEDADVAVVVIGESPYAEGQGDKEFLGFSQADVETLRRVKTAGIPTVVLLLSGRPLILDRVLHDADILFAAWLPGTEGDGIADVLFGDFEPSGKLTHSWPRAMDQIPLNWGDEIYNPLYPYKHGISSNADYGPEVAPLFHSAQLQNNGSILELAFSKAMNAADGNGGFVVLVNDNLVNVNSVSVKENDLSVLELELDKAANAGDAITVSYSPGTVTAVDGSSLESFTPVAAYNLLNEGSGPQPIPGKVEAENFSAMKGVEFAATTDIGGGNHITSIDNTDWVEYNLIVPDSNLYSILLRISSLSTSARIGYVLDDVLISTWDLPVTGSWDSWTTVPTELNIASGEHRLKIFAFIGGFNLNWMDITIQTAINNIDLLATAYSLDQNFPNPFNPSTTLSFSIPTPGYVDLTIFNIKGEKIENLIDKKLTEGKHKVLFDASRFSSGIYIYRLLVNGKSLFRKMLLIK